MLVNSRGEIFLGCRLDMPDAWQMPQGGIEPGEGVTDAALREMEEEVGTRQARILAETADWHRYDFPDYLAGRIYGGKYRGQQQKWVLALFTGQDDDIDLAAGGHREFAAWKWVPPKYLCEAVVPFKRHVYEAVLEEFSPVLEKLARGQGPHNRA
ncbi:MAG: RNA pyrophosphohydrolase [Pseudomonadota bacterium]|nr:RNA pyrophosphohydrolase [Pseudomonadota bacterium]